MASMQFNKVQATNCPSHTRWKIAGLLCVLAMTNYFLRTNISVAGHAIMRDFHLTQTQMGTVFSAFVLGYTLFQIPGGMLADRYGPRIVLAVAAVLWGIFTCLAGIVGKISLLTGLSVLNALIVLRFVLGLSEGPMFPASARAIANWFPLAERARANGLAIAGASIGSFSMPPLVTWMVLHLNWQSSFYIVGAFSVLIAVVWVCYMRDDPAKHWAVNEAELSHIRGSSALSTRQVSLPSSKIDQLHNPNLWRLIVSYALNGYVFYVFVFWFYLYLVQVRHFGQVEGAWLTTTPWVLAACTTVAGGYLSDRLIASRLGADWGRRIVPMACQIGVAIFLVIGARVENGYLGSAILALSIGLILGVEGPYWATATEISREATGFTGGLLNTGGNLGGVISPILTPLMAKRVGWVHALDLTSLVALAAAGMWLWVVPSRGTTGS